MTNKKMKKKIRRSGMINRGFVRRGWKGKTFFPFSVKILFPLFLFSPFAFSVWGQTIKKINKRARRRDAKSI